MMVTLGSFAGLFFIIGIIDVDLSLSVSPIEAVLLANSSWTMVTVLVFRLNVMPLQPT